MSGVRGTSRIELSGQTSGLLAENSCTFVGATRMHADSFQKWENGRLSGKTTRKQSIYSGWAGQRAELVHSCHEAHLCCWPIVTPGPQSGWEYVMESTKEWGQSENSEWNRGRLSVRPKNLSIKAFNLDLHRNLFKNVYFINRVTNFLIFDWLAHLVFLWSFILWNI